MENYNNIPKTGFVATNTVTKTEKRISTFNESSTISLSLFSLTQLIYGAKLAIEEIKTSSISIELVKMYMTLSEAMIESGSEGKPINVTRTQMIYLRDWLQSRMTHCEKERDERSDKFNADTYIGQKLLLLDIREWLIGESFPIDNNE